MSTWTHAICDACWFAKNPEREPVRSAAARIKPCCYCGREGSGGIFVREGPTTAPCGGRHRDEDDEP